MTPEERKKKTEEVIAGLAEDMAPLVQDIEARPNTTQNHYADWGAVIRKFGGDELNKQTLIVLALLKAGANRHGVLTAYQMVKDGLL